MNLKITLILTPFHHLIFSFYSSKKFYLIAFHELRNNYPLAKLVLYWLFYSTFPIIALSNYYSSLCLLLQARYNSLKKNLWKQEFYQSHHFTSLQWVFIFFLCLIWPKSLNSGWQVFWFENIVGHQVWSINWKLAVHMMLVL